MRGPLHYPTSCPLVSCLSLLPSSCVCFPFSVCFVFSHSSRVLSVVCVCAGAYNLDTTIGRGPAKTLSGRYQQQATDQTPGPGTQTHHTQGETDTQNRHRGSRERERDRLGGWYRAEVNVCVGGWCVSCQVRTMFATALVPMLHATPCWADMQMSTRSNHQVRHTPHTNSKQPTPTNHQRA